MKPTARHAGIGIETFLDEYMKQLKGVTFEDSEQKALFFTLDTSVCKSLQLLIVYL